MNSKLKLQLVMNSVKEENRVLWERKEGRILDWSEKASLGCVT